MLVGRRSGWRKEDLELTSFLTSEVSGRDRIFGGQVLPVGGGVAKELRVAKVHAIGSAQSRKEQAQSSWRVR